MSQGIEILAAIAVCGSMIYRGWPVCPGFHYENPEQAKFCLKSSRRLSSCQDLSCQPQLPTPLWEPR